MDEQRRAFLESLLDTATPSGFEVAGQRLWTEYVSEFADEVRTDDYGNAVAVLSGGDPEVALAGHGDEIGFMVRDVTESGMLRLTAIGGSDRTVSQGQHVRVHTDDGIGEQHVDVGAEDGDEAEALVERGDPVTFDQTIADLENGRIAARGLDNRIGVWAAAEGLRRAAERGTEATVYAVSTVQEELGLQGAKMVGFDLAPDAVVATDVTHATDTPGAPPDKGSGVELGEGPVVGRGSANHPSVVSAVREAADGAGIDVQLAASGSRTGTDADAFYTSRGGIPSLNLGVPNRYMHTPVEVLDLADLDATADLLAAFAAGAGGREFGVEV
jgi:putative aminopeptidase FrvX